MTFQNNPRVLVSPQSFGQIDRLLDAIIEELKPAIDLFRSHGNNLGPELLMPWLQFYEKLRKDKTSVVEISDVLLNYDTLLTKQHDERQALKKQAEDNSQHAFGAQTALEQSQARVDRLQRLITELQRQVDTIPDLNNRVMVAERNLRTEREGNATLSSKLTKAERDLSGIASLRSRAEAAEGAVRPLQAEKTRLEADNSSLLVQLRGMTDQQSRITDLKSKLAAAEQLIIGLRDELIKKSEELTRLEAEAEARKIDLDGIVRPVLILAAKEVERFERAKDAFTDLEACLVQAMNRLSDSIKPANAQPVVVSNSPGAAISVEAVVLEITRREEWMRELTEYSLQVEEEKAELEELYQGQSDVPVELIQLRRLHEMLRGMESKARQDQEALLKYKRAVESVNTGIPEGLLGAALPSLPTADNLPTLETRRPAEPKRPTQPLEVTVADGSRIDVLKSLATVYKLAPSAMLVITLYDCLPHSTRNTKRSVEVVVRRAIRAGIFASYGMTDEIEILNSWTERNHRLIELLVAEAGRVPGHNLRIRTERNLPWKIDQVLTQAEVRKFQKEVLDK